MPGPRCPAAPRGEHPQLSSGPRGRPRFEPATPPRWGQPRWGHRAGPGLRWPVVSSPLPPEERQWPNSRGSRWLGFPPPNVLRTAVAVSPGMDHTASRTRWENRLVSGGTTITGQVPVGLGASTQKPRLARGLRAPPTPGGAGATIWYFIMDSELAKPPVAAAATTSPHAARGGGASSANPVPRAIACQRVVGTAGSAARRAGAQPTARSASHRWDASRRPRELSLPGARDPTTHQTGPESAPGTACEPWAGGEDRERTYSSGSPERRRACSSCCSGETTKSSSPSMTRESW